MHWSLQSEENETWIRIVGIVRRNIETNRNFGTILSPGIQLGHFPTHKSIENVHRFGTRCSNSLTNSHLLMVKFTVKIWQMTKKHLGWGTYWFVCVCWIIEWFGWTIVNCEMRFSRIASEILRFSTPRYPQAY